ncbi:MAG: hypothetical protein ACT4P8_09105 [Betaproteobacteria bacterium]
MHEKAVSRAILQRPANFFDGLRVAIDDEATPLVIEQQKPGISLSVIINTYFDKSVARLGNSGNQVLDDSIFAKLRKNSEFCGGKVCRTISPPDQVGKEATEQY